MRVNKRAHNLYTAIANSAALTPAQRADLADLYEMAKQVEPHSQRWSRFFEIALGAVGGSGVLTKVIIRHATEIANAALEREIEHFRSPE